MKLSFIPGGLQMSEISDGSYVVTLKGEEVYRTASSKAAIRCYNKIRGELVSQFPKTEASEQEKIARLKREIADNLVGHDSLRPQRRRYRRGSTRTFG